jgi:predicted PurR-regulated permease PerM
VALTDARAARVLTTALLFALGLGFLYITRRTLIAFLFAIFFAYLVDPAVSRVEKWTHSRGVAVGIIYLLLLLLVATFFFVGPQIGHQAQRLCEALSHLLDQVSSGNIAVTIGQERGWSDTTIHQAQAFLTRHRDDLVAIAQRVGVRVAAAAQESWLLIVVPILAIFLLKDGRAFGEVGLAFVQTRPQREFWEGVRGDLNRMLAHFIRAQLTLAAFSLIVYTAGMALMRVPYALVLGTAGGIMEFIPVVGPLVAAVVILGVALLMSYSNWVMLLVWRFGVVRLPGLPAHYGQEEPHLSAFRVLAGGEIAGVLGVYLSIPVMASLRIVWRRWRMYAEKKRFGPLNEYSFGAEISPSD